MIFKVAAIQMTTNPNVEANLLKAGELITQASQQGAKLAVLPENFPIMTNQAQDKLKIIEEEGHGIIQNFLAAQAKNNKIWIVGGTIPLKASDPTKFRAACLVYDDQGQQVARYDKIHLFDVDLGNNQIYKESELIEPGNQIVVVNTPFGKLGLAVCYDIRFSGLFMAMAERGVEIIAIPAAFTVPTGQAHWELLTRARAVENFSYVVGACQVGNHDIGSETYGHSVIIDPWGKVMAMFSESNPGIIIAEIDMSYLKEKRNAIPIDKHRRIKCDISMLRKE